jgi:hypothetical protein
VCSSVDTGKAQNKDDYVRNFTFFHFKQKFDGSFVNCIKQANQDAEQLLRIVFDNFTPFQDYSLYNGKRGKQWISRKLAIGSMLHCNLFLSSSVAETSANTDWRSVGVF